MEGAERILRGLGFSSYEARALVALARKHPANGYEVGKLSGIPGSKVYGVLEGLRNSGFVIADESTKPLRYEPLPPGELASRLREAHEGAVGTLEEELGRIAPLPDLELSWNLPDYGSVVERMRRMIAGARRRLMASVWPGELEALRPELELAIERGVVAVVASFGPVVGLGPYALDISGCGESSARRLGSRLTALAADGREVLVSEIRSVSETVGLWTRSREIVLVAEEYIRHDIWGRALLDELGPGALELLAAKAPLVRLLLNER
jgi:Predicted transcriptional regulators